MRKDTEICSFWLHLRGLIIPRVTLTYTATRIQRNTEPCIYTEKESCCCFYSCFCELRCDLTQTAWRNEKIVVNEEFNVHGELPVSTLSVDPHMKFRNRLSREKRKVYQTISKYSFNPYLGTSVSLKNVWSCESLSVPYLMRVWRAKSEIVSMGVCIRDTVR